LTLTSVSEMPFVFKRKQLRHLS